MFISSPKRSVGGYDMILHDDSQKETKIGSLQLNGIRLLATQYCLCTRLKLQLKPWRWRLLTPVLSKHSDDVKRNIGAGPHVLKSRSLKNLDPP